MLYYSESNKGTRDTLIEEYPDYTSNHLTNGKESVIFSSFNSTYSNITDKENLKKEGPSPNLGGGDLIPPPLCWFSFNNSETVKAVTLGFCSIQYHFIRDVCTKFGVPYSPPSPSLHMLGKTQAGVFPICTFPVNPL